MSDNDGINDDITHNSEITQLIEIYLAKHSLGVSAERALQQNMMTKTRHRVQVHKAKGNAKDKVYYPDNVTHIDTAKKPDEYSMGMATLPKRWQCKFCREWQKEEASCCADCADKPSKRHAMADSRDRLQWRREIAEEGRGYPLFLEYSSLMHEPSSKHLAHQQTNSAFFEKYSSAGSPPLLERDALTGEEALTDEGVRQFRCGNKNGVRAKQVVTKGIWEALASECKPTEVIGNGLLDACSEAFNKLAVNSVYWSFRDWFIPDYELYAELGISEEEANALIDWQSECFMHSLHRAMAYSRDRYTLGGFTLIGEGGVGKTSTIDAICKLLQREAEKVVRDYWGFEMNNLVYETHTGSGEIDKFKVGSYCLKNIITYFNESGSLYKGKRAEEIKAILGGGMVNFRDMYRQSNKTAPLRAVIIMDCNHESITKLLPTSVTGEQARRYQILLLKGRKEGVFIPNEEGVFKHRLLISEESKQHLLASIHYYGKVNEPSDYGNSPKGSLADSFFKVINWAKSDGGLSVASGLMQKLSDSGKVIYKRTDLTNREKGIDAKDLQLNALQLSSCLKYSGKEIAGGTKRTPRLKLTLSDSAKTRINLNLEFVYFPQEVGYTDALALIKEAIATAKTPEEALQIQRQLYWRESEEGWDLGTGYEGKEALDTVLASWINTPSP